jgi:hypothetical protein
MCLEVTLLNVMIVRTVEKGFLQFYVFFLILFWSVA